MSTYGTRFLESGAKVSEIAMVNLAQARNYLVPFGLAYYVPRIRGKPILPEGWEPRIREDDVILETITPAFSTVKIEPRNTESTASPQAAAAGLASRERRIERDADKLTRLSSLPQLIFDRVRMRTDSPRIYGSVTPEDILAELHETHGLVLEKDAVKLDARIKDLGEHVVAVEVGTGNVKITIVVKDLGAENVTAGNANDATPPTPLA
ncbi:hypothetical protein HKX48_008620 [Thoreauomyces humboldtii]|nr:hypothetical protein HKX48_008620 [Thoreauomyces humboldtii]